MKRGASPMRVAVTSFGESLESPIDQRFGRARFFIVYDLETGQWSAHNNKQNLEATQGAGVQSAQHVVNLGADAVITGHCGPKAFATLTAAEVEIYQNATGSVQEAIGAYKAGSLGKSAAANVDAGFGSV
jgi:predicted Fe-Mo cluster-binding NifX family protein